MSNASVSAAVLPHKGGLFLSDEELELVIDHAPHVDSHPNNPEGWLVWAAWMPTKSQQLGDPDAQVAHLDNGKWLWWVPKQVNLTTGVVTPAFFEIKHHP